jgi:hypothetical protein
MELLAERQDSAMPATLANPAEPGLKPSAEPRDPASAAAFVQR